MIQHAIEFRRPRSYNPPPACAPPGPLNVNLVLTAARYVVGTLGSDMRIVLVDPSRIVTRMVASLIRPWHHEVFEFVDGAAALAAIKADSSVSAVITSAELRTMSGV